jgi:hypothetical protein
MPTQHEVVVPVVEVKSYGWLSSRAADPPEGTQRLAAGMFLLSAVLLLCASWLGEWTTVIVVLLGTMPANIVAATHTARARRHRRRYERLKLRHGEVITASAFLTAAGVVMPTVLVPWCQVASWSLEATSTGDCDLVCRPNETYFGTLWTALNRHATVFLASAALLLAGLPIIVAEYGPGVSVAAVTCAAVHHLLGGLGFMLLRRCLARARTEARALVLRPLGDEAPMRAALTAWTTAAC